MADARSSASPESAVTESFEAQAPAYLERYDPRTTAGHSFSIRKQRVLEIIESVPPGPVLDVGCGPGIFVQELLDRGFDYHGADIAPRMIEVCRQRFSHVDPSRFSVGRIQSIAFPDRTFNLVLVIGVVEYVEDDDEALREVHRVLKPGGTAIISMPNRRGPFVRWSRLVYKPAQRLLKRMRGKPVEEELFHREYLEREYVERLRRNGFEPVRAVYYNFKLVPSPLDRLLRGFTVWSSARLEFLATGSLRWLGTGMLVVARRVATSRADA